MLRDCHGYTANINRRVKSTHLLDLNRYFFFSMIVHRYQKGSLISNIYGAKLSDNEDFNT